MSEKKVFCATCRYRIIESPESGCKLTKYIQETPEHRFKFYKECKDINKNNDCKDYRRSLLHTFAEWLYDINH